MGGYIARLIDQEGVVWGEFAIPRFLHEIRVPVMSQIGAKMVREIGPWDLINYSDVWFKYERKTGDGVLIYRRATPLWKA